MNSREKQRLLAAYDRACLVATLAQRGVYVFGSLWRGHACGQTRSTSAGGGADDRNTGAGGQTT